MRQNPSTSLPGVQLDTSIRAICAENFNDGIFKVRDDLGGVTGAAVVLKVC
jgi:hypothetical protein